MTSLKVGLLGGGSWGTTVASLIAKNTDVSLWARDSKTVDEINKHCLLYTSPSPRDKRQSRMPSSA